MTTRNLVHTAATLGLVATAALALFAANAATAPARNVSTGARTLLVSTSGTLHPTRTLAPQHAARAGSYDWPIKPFDRQHALRGFFDDPRIGAHGSQAFHFGVDVAAPDGTPVYAVDAGTVYFDSPHAIAVVAPDGSHTIGYWHIDPAVRSHQLVQRHQLLGRIQAPWGHVHLAETHGVHHYVNPLRPGGLGPYVDRVAPTIEQIELVATGRRSLGVIVDAYDTPSPAVPGVWAGNRVAPALIEFRLTRNGHAGPWRTAVDFRETLVDAKLFSSVYAPGTRQNHERKPGLYLFWLERSWKPADGAYRLEVRASDTGGNRATGRLDFTVADGAPLP